MAVGYRVTDSPGEVVNSAIRAQGAVGQNINKVSNGATCKTAVAGKKSKKK